MPELISTSRQVWFVQSALSLCENGFWRNWRVDALLKAVSVTLAAAFIASRVDNCNSVLYGGSSQVVRRLQMVLNAAARLVVGVGRYEHIMPALCDVLHWLPVPQRIQFKIAVSATVSVSMSCLLQQRLHPSRQHFWSGKSLFGRSHDMLVLSARTQLGRQSLHVAGCSPNRLERTSITAPLIIH